MLKSVDCSFCERQNNGSVLNAESKIRLGQTGRSLDSDPTETREWVDSLEAVVRESGPERGLFLLEELEDQLRRAGIRPSVQPYSAYRNTIPVERQGSYPGDLAIEERITSLVRWNALAMVVRANQAYGELGGHIASYASAAEIFELGVHDAAHSVGTCRAVGVRSTPWRYRLSTAMVNSPSPPMARRCPRRWP
jgi:hypothetical protein